MRYYRFIGFVTTILGKIIIVAIFIISSVALGKAIVEDEEDN